MSSQCSTSRLFKLALVQLGNVTSDEKANLMHAREKIEEAADNGANVVVLPECFNSPYGTKHFKKYAKKLEESAAVSMLSDVAQKKQVYVIGGSIPEIFGDSEKIYNTLTVYNKSGERIATHRKVHLFDIDIPNEITFRESDVLSPGNHMTHVDTDYGRFGVGICYDMRFPEMAMVAARKGCIAMIYPGAFNQTTGPKHWELLLRARAVDNQFFVAGCSPATDRSADYHAWGHSAIVNPSGQVISDCGESEAIIYADIDLQDIEKSRAGIPLYTQRRFDLYDDVSVNAQISLNNAPSKKDRQG